jgi:hypothetical protein
MIDLYKNTDELTIDDEILLIIMEWDLQEWEEYLQSL